MSKEQAGHRSQREDGDKKRPFQTARSTGSTCWLSLLHFSHFDTVHCLIHTNAELGNCFGLLGYRHCPIVRRLMCSCRNVAKVYSSPNDTRPPTGDVHLIGCRLLCFAFATSCTSCGVSKGLRGNDATGGQIFALAGAGEKGGGSMLITSVCT